MKSKKEAQLSILYTRKITITNAVFTVKGKDEIDKTSIEKECLVRKSPEQYCIELLDGIRYVIFQDKENKGYTVVGRKMGGNKYKNYYLQSYSIDEICTKLQMKRSDVKDETLAGNVLKLFLQHILFKNKNNKTKFYDHVKKNYGINYDHSTL